MQAERLILDYHETTKHHFHRYARSAGHMDWHNQPHPFRHYEGAEIARLPLPPAVPDISYAALYDPSPGKRHVLTHSTLSGFLYHSLAISAWKAVGSSRWSLRVHPSSGNLHPTECHIVALSVEGLADGVYHYNALAHALFRRIDLTTESRSAWAEAFPGPGFALALSTIFWRESWKYGERALRYCLLDAGHAAAAVAIAARLFGWRAHCLTGAGDGQIGTLLGFDRTVWHPLESETPEMLFWIDTEPREGTTPRTLPADLVRSCQSLAVKGRPMPLSRKVRAWSIIDRTASAAEKQPTSTLPCDLLPLPVHYPPPADLGAAEVLRQRRSAVSYDPGRTIASDTFWAILDRTLPRTGIAPFDIGLPGPAVDLLLFVHRVTAVPPGLYLLIRSAENGALSRLKSCCRPEFLWEPVRPGFPLWRLSHGDVCYEAMEVSCHQEIAAHGAFAVAMLAPLASTVAARPFMYRHLHWECGMIGQVLYLEAEAHGIRGTGMGCFFDDAVTERLGITDGRLNSLYHFTIGYPIEDRRITTLPAYHHLQQT